VCREDIHAHVVLHTTSESPYAMHSCSKDCFDSVPHIPHCGLAGEDCVAATQQSHDEACGMCRKGGELLCCDSCRAAFHLACISLAEVPPGDWFCAVCADQP